MTTLHTPKEIYPGYVAQRTGEAIVLLSLDSQKPFFPLVEAEGVPAAGAFQYCIRETILDYREFKPGSHPELASFAGAKIEAMLGRDRKQAFDFWLCNVFVFSADDYRPFGAWMRFMTDLFKLRVAIDENFGLPARLSGDAVQRGLAALSLADFHQVQDEHDDDPLSEWDIDMYARHGLYAEEREPEIPMKLTFKQLRFRRYVEWLLSSMTPAEIDDWQHKAREHVSSETVLPDLRTQVLPHAEDFA